MNKKRFPTVGWAGLLAMCLCCGCAHYEFDVVQPPLNGHVGRHSDTHISIDPMVYRLRSVGGRLVVWIENPKSDPIELLGHKSTAVDPWGQSHPLEEQTIAPGSYIKLVIPPLRPQGEGPQPPVSQVGGPYGNMDQPGYIRPSGYGTQAAQATDDSELRYWEWNDESEIQLNLVFQRGDKTFTQTFVIRRVRT
jgi:hypothetical protein